MKKEENGSFALSTQRRLHYRREFLRFFHKSQVFRLGVCIIFRIPNSLGHFRLGITLKSRGSSVQRNRVKRQIRESMRRLSQELGSYDYNVVIPQTQSLSHSTARRISTAIHTEFKAKLRRI